MELTLLLTIISGSLLTISESLPFFSAIKSNGIIDFIANKFKTKIKESEVPVIQGLQGLPQQQFNFQCIINRINHKKLKKKVYKKRCKKKD